MSDFTQTEENYIKTIFHLSLVTNDTVGTNEIAAMVNSTPASVTDMLKKLKEKEIIHYKKYQGVRLTELGEAVAKNLVRNHRLWEVFLVHKLQYGWDKIHDIAEQLEHIKDEELYDKLDNFLGNPKFDPHGDPIPDKKGNIKSVKQVALSTVGLDFSGKVLGVSDNSSKFLQYLDQLGIKLGTSIHVKNVIEFDGTLEVAIDKKKIASLSRMAAQQIFVG